MGDFWKITAEMYTSLIEKPKMNQKLLSKPPFKYIFDIVAETIKKTGFAKGLFEGAQAQSDFYNDKDKKIAYLQKVIKLVELMQGNQVDAKPQKVVAGLQPELTNILLQGIYKCATGGKSSESFVKKILGIQDEEENERPQPNQNKIKRPPSAARTKKITQNLPQKKIIQEDQIQHKQQIQQPVQKKVVKQQYSKKVKQLMQQGQEQQKIEQQITQKEIINKKDINLGRLNKKKQKNLNNQDKILNLTGQLTQQQLKLVQNMIQSICYNTAPLGKTIQFINDDVESMNKQLIYWRKQYNISKNKMKNQIKISQDTLLPIYDKITQIQQQIKDQKSKIQNTKSQIIKNDFIIKDLLMSVITPK